MERRSAVAPSRSPLIFLVATALCCAFSAPPAGATEIWEIQGSGSESPLAGQRVTTGPNVVTALAHAGFFIQTPSARSDGDSATSDGLYVYLGETPGFREGDLVEVTGTVAEYHGMTELSDNPEVTVTDHGAEIPAAIDFGPNTPSPNDPPPERSLERFEGMLVRIRTGSITGPGSASGAFWVVARAGRAFREPGIPFPGEPGLPVWDGNPEILAVEQGFRGPIKESPDSLTGAGLTIRSLVGPLAYRWGHYEVWVLPQQFSIEGEIKATPVRPTRRGEIILATQNVERLYDTLDDPNTKDEVTPQWILDIKLSKLSLWIRNVLRSPTIIALQEVENLGILQELADRVAADGGPHYAAHLLEGNDISGIDVGYLVGEDFAVDSLEQLGADERFSYGGLEYTLWDRPPLLLRGRFTGNGVPFRLGMLDVHLRSMNGIDGDTAGFVREKRHQQAVWLSRAIQQLQKSEPELRLAVLGDFNAFEFTDGWVDVMGQITGHPDPLGALIPATDEIDPDLTDQVLAVRQESRYSFIHEGSAQVLDHILTSVGLDPWIRGAMFAHGNADTPVSWETAADFPQRCSDHDGLVLYLMTDANGNGIPDDREPPTPRRIRARLVPQALATRSFHSPAP